MLTGLKIFIVLKFLKDLINYLDKRKEKDAAYNYLVQRYRVFDHAPQTVNNGREGDGARCITVPVHLGPSSCEVKYCAALKQNNNYFIEKYPSLKQEIVP